MQNTAKVPIFSNVHLVKKFKITNVTMYIFLDTTEKMSKKMKDVE